MWNSRHRMKLALAPNTVILYSVFVRLAVFINSIKRLVLRALGLVAAACSGKHRGASYRLPSSDEAIMKTYSIKAVSAQQPVSFNSGQAYSSACVLTPRAMVTDICLVAAWGAMIPGLMWLGVAGGF